MDSEMMNISSNILKQCTRSLTKFVCSYNQSEFAEKLVCIASISIFPVNNYCS